MTAHVHVPHDVAVALNDICASRSLGEVPVPRPNDQYQVRWDGTYHEVKDGKVVYNGILEKAPSHDRRNIGKRVRMTRNSDTHEFISCEIIS